MIQEQGTDSELLLILIFSSYNLNDPRKKESDLKCKINQRKIRSDLKVEKMKSYYSIARAKKT